MALEIEYGDGRLIITPSTELTTVERTDLDHDWALTTQHTLGLPDHTYSQPLTPVSLPSDIFGDFTVPLPLPTYRNIRLAGNIILVMNPTSFYPLPADVAWSSTDPIVFYPWDLGHVDIAWDVRGGWKSGRTFGPAIQSG